MHRFMHKLLIIFVIMIPIILSGCSKQENKEDNIVYVKTQKISTGDISDTDKYSGQVKSKYENNLSFQVSGKIIKRYVNVGDHVKAGQPIMKLDTDDLSQNLSKADEQVNSAKAQLDLASSNLRRYKQLYEKEAISASTLDSYQTNYKAALSSYNQAKAQADLARNSLDYATLRANCDGVISSLVGETGQVVSQGQTVATLSQDNGICVIVNVPENKIAKIRIGEDVKLSFWAIPDLKVDGKVWTISPQADPNTRTYEVKIAMNNPLDSIHLGMTADARFLEGKTGDNKDVTIPLSAFYQTGDKPKVWEVNDGKVHLRDVTVKTFNKNNAVVVGLEDGTIIVTAGADKLTEGEKVKINDGDQL